MHPAQCRAGAVLTAFENPIANFFSINEALKKSTISHLYINNMNLYTLYTDKIVLLIFFL